MALPRFAARSYEFTEFVPARNWIAGAWQEPAAGAPRLDVPNPRWGRPMASVALSSPADVDRAVARFHRRGSDAIDDPWHTQVRAIVAAEGGDPSLERRHAALLGLLELPPEAVVIPSVEGDVDATYERLVATLAN